ncbi:MAG: asparagine synthase (glutamine-hydrolyzing) [Nitrospirales bacterium]|nr:asparagine synthase (glutamine-hydrolyzing) [Nitrospirales bacterium]
MCGIAGIVNDGANFSREQLAEIVIAMRETMVHRGPDDAGVWVDPNGRCALAHRRLSIIDLSSEGRQPIGNENGTVQVTFNGEIYNYQELRKKLEAKGHTFRSQSDSEVLPHLFEDMDARRFNELDGMFAMGIWHRDRQHLLLSRDPFGKKPLYYCAGSGWFAFASELQALTVVPEFDATIDLDGLAQYLMLQYVPAPLTIYRGVKKLSPGTYLQADFSRGQISEPQISSYFTFFAHEDTSLGRSSQPDVLEELRGLVLTAVQKRLVSDVPLGAFLSGGVDSSLVVAMMAKELGRPVKTFSIGFEGTEETEHLYARQIAKHLGTEHHEQTLKADAVSLLPQVANMLDEPNGDSSCLPTFLLCQYTKQFVTVALSGDGGDEMFGGYGRYRDTLLEQTNWISHMARCLKTRKWAAPADGYLSPRWLIFQPEQVRDLMGEQRPSIRNCLANWRRQLNNGKEPLIHRMRNLDVQTYLPGAVLAKVDRMSMQVSLEVRCPLLDRAVAKFAQSVSASLCWQPPDQTKFILKQFAERYFPPSWVRRKKMGFGLPSNAWSRQDMLDLAREALFSSNGALAGLVDRSVLEALINRQSLPGHFSIYQVWPLLILEFWLRKRAT